MRRAVRITWAALVLALVLGACGNDGTEPAAGGQETVQASSPVTAAGPEETPEPTPADDCTLESEKRYQDRALISVTSPCSGQVVASPVTITGDANVFEANVSFRILDENGTAIATGFTTAECGTGCWGAYRDEVKFKIDHEQPGTVEVFESSAKDGSDVNKISIPVILVP